MSHFSELMKTIRAVTAEIGIPAMAERAQMSDDALRGLIKGKFPRQIEKLELLERIADEIENAKKPAA